MYRDIQSVTAADIDNTECLLLHIYNTVENIISAMASAATNHEALPLMIFNNISVTSVLVPWAMALGNAIMEVNIKYGNMILRIILFILFLKKSSRTECVSENMSGL